MSSGKKSDFLGMPFGTAAQRLRKNILFHLLQKHGENVCFSCGETINSVDELSIEHKKPWEGRSVEFFWDMGNIAFSHLACNRNHTVKGHPAWPVLRDTEGNLQCVDCKEFKPLSAYSQNKKRKVGVQPYCRPCHSKRTQKHKRAKKSAGTE